MVSLKHTKKLSIITSHITIFFLFLSIIPLNLLFSFTEPNHINDYQITAEKLASIKIERLMKNSNQTLSSLFDTYIDNDSKILSSPNFRIGEQIGNGEGTYQIYDSLIKINSTSLNTQNILTEGSPGGHNTTFTIDPLMNFSRESLDFQIMNVLAEEDWRLIENETADADQRDSTTFIEVAQNFEIEESNANITSIEVYVTYHDMEFGGGIPHGNISVFSDNSGEPDTQLGTTTLEEGFESLNLGVTIGPAWVTYTFSNPISVSKGSYWLVLNDTGNQDDGYWDWFSQNASNGNPGDMLAKSSHGGSWNLNPFPEGDILSAIRVLSTDSSYNRLSYSSPEEISMTYNTSIGDYELSSFILEANNTNIHNFYTNTSISFTLRNVGNYTYSSNPLSAYATYQVQNSTNSFWNLTFSTIRINTKDEIQNRTITINGIHSDWNGSEIYWNESISPEYTDLTNNPNVTWDGNPIHNYTYGNTTMVINASGLLENVTWHVCFSAPNYISYFELERNLLKLSLPFKANVTDILDITFSVEEDGGNASYWIEYDPTGIEVFGNTNISYSSKTVSDTWDICDTLSQITNINGTYGLQAFWINNDRCKVGTFIRTLDLYVNTSFDIQADTEVIVGELFTVTGFYKSVHNETDIKNAKIWCDASWSSATDVFMNQIPSDYSYNASFLTSGQTPGVLGNITITTQVGWFVNWTKIVFIRFVENSSISIDINNEELEWCQNTTIYISYLNSTGGSILDASVTVNGGTATYNSTFDAYLFLLNTTDYSGVGSYTDIPVNATHYKYRSLTENVSFLITPGITNITGLCNDIPCENNTEIIVPFAESSADNLSINLEYYHILTNNILSTNEPEIESLVPHMSPVIQGDNSWVVTFDPHQTGTYMIQITFTLTNYYNALFMFNVTVQDAETKIHTEYLNQTEIYYTEFLEFSLLFKNADWNENITLNGQGSIIISNETILQYLNCTDDYYWFRFSSVQLSAGQHMIQVRFLKTNFEDSEITLVFSVVEMPTLEIPISDVHLTNNGSIQIEDPLEIMIYDYVTFKGSRISYLDEIFVWLNGTSVPSINLIDLELTQAPFSFNLVTHGWQYGFYNLTFQIHVKGYQSQFFSHNITLLGLPTSIAVEIEPGKNIHQGEDIIFITTLSYSEEGSMNGYGSLVLQHTPLEDIEISYYIAIKYKNGSIRIFEDIVLINESGEARFTIDGYYTKGAVGFENITIQSSSGLSALPASYTMSTAELASYEIIPPAVNVFDIIVVVLIIVTILLVTAVVTGKAVQTIRRRRVIHKQLILQNDESIERGFEDIKSIRLILAKHASGLQFYVENTISDFQADTDADALSGMSTAISQFIEDVSERMHVRNENGSLKEKFEAISREGFYMLIWNGRYSSLIIISELQLPDYFKGRLEKLGSELEETFEDNLKNFYDLDQLPSSIIRKIVRKYIPLHYFSAFVLNEGVLTLKSIKLSKKDKKMLSEIKKLYFVKDGVQYFFSEQIISYLAKKYKRSEAITFLEKVIEWNLLLECNQEELMQLNQ